MLVLVARFTNLCLLAQEITAKDHAAVQLNIAHLDDDGVYTGAFTTFALSGKTRSMGESDSALDHLWAKKKAEVGQTY